MNFVRWLLDRFSNRGSSLWYYRRGMARAHKHDHPGAVQDYTMTIGMEGTPGDVKAMALYNRALVHVAAGDEEKGAEDLNAVLAMNETSVNVRTMARQKLARMETRATKQETRATKRAAS